MSSLQWGLVLLALALAGNLALRRLVRFVDGLNGIDNCAPERAEYGVDVSSVDVEALLAAHGISGGAYEIHSERLPVSAQLSDMAMRFEKVVFDEHDETFIREYLDLPYEPNPHYLRIGSMEDGSAVLMKCNSTDDAVYVAWVEDGDEFNPERYAGSLQEYVIKCWHVAVESQKQDE